MTYKMINDAQKTRVFVAPEGKKGFVVTEAS